MGKFLQRCTESFNPMSTQFFTFYSQQHWGFCVYLYSPHATSSRGERRTAAILHSYKILSHKCVFLLPSPINLHPWLRRDEMKWTRLIRAVSGCEHWWAQGQHTTHWCRQWLLPRDPKPCPSTSSLTLMPFLHSSELFSGELAYFKPAAHKVTVSASRLHHTVFSPAFINLLCVTLPTHDCTEIAEIFGVSFSIWLMEGCYVRMSTLLRKRGNFLIFVVIK